MKKSRILISSVFLAGAIAASIAAAGCSHTHTFSEEWTNDETNHWHAATCNHTDKQQDVGAHEYDDHYKCTVCGYQHEHTFNANYVCTVCDYAPADAGIVIVKETTDYTLDGATTMNVPMDDFTVKVRKENGMDANVVADFSLKYYKDNVEIPNLNGVGAGAYNVWATATLDGKQTESFVVVYILDDVVSIAVKPDEGEFEQEVGPNSMSKTWKYTVTYKSGRTEEVSAEDVKVENLVTNKVSEEGAKATVSYTYKNIKGKETTVQTEVPYTVVEGSGIKIQTTAFTADTLAKTSENTTADTVLVEGMMTAKSGIAVDANAKSYTDANDSANNRSYSQRLKLNGAGNTTSRSVEIVTTGKAKIVVYAQSSNGSEDRQLALAKSTYKSWLESPTEIVGETKTCLGASLTRVEYEVAEAGTYYLVSTSGGINIYGVEVSVETTSADTPSASSNVAIGSDDFTNGTLTTETAVKDGVLSITAQEGSTVVIEDNAKAYTDASESANNRSFTKRVKLGGEGKAIQRSLKITTTGKAKIIIYAMSSSGEASRQVGLYNSTFVDKNTAGALVGELKTLAGDKIYRLEWEVDAADTYYFASSSGGTNVYGVEIIYG